MEATIEELQAQFDELQKLVLSLTANLLREAAQELSACRYNRRDDAERMFREAEACFRCARLPRLKSEIAEGLEVAGRELMAKAVEIETALQRAERKT